MVLRHAVQMQETDQMGHMNVQFYVQKSVLAAWTQWAQLGCARRAWRTQPVLREQHMRFLAEQLPGTPFYMCGGELAQDDASALVLYQEMRHSATHKPLAAFTSRWQCAHQGQPAWPAGLRAALQPLRIQPPPHGQARGVAMNAPRPRPTRAEAERLKMLTTWLGALLPTQCDAAGELLDWGPMGIVSDAIPNMLAQAQQFDPGAAVQKDRRGGAALEYRFVYHARARTGDALQLYSGLRALGRKTYHWVHWLCDIASGEAIATAEAVAINIDLQARKALDMDEATRALLAPRCNPTLSV